MTVVFLFEDLTQLFAFFLSKKMDNFNSFVLNVNGFQVFVSLVQWMFIEFVYGAEILKAVFIS